jgi:hypothetical protein
MADRPSYRVLVLLDHERMLAVDRLARTVKILDDRLITCPVDPLVRCPKIEICDLRLALDSVDGVKEFSDVDAIDHCTCLLLLSCLFHFITPYL